MNDPITEQLGNLPGLGIGILLLLGAFAVFSPLLRVRLRRSLTPIALTVIAIVLLAGYLNANGLDS